MAIYTHPHIHTADGQILVGHIYSYSEDRQVCHVKVLEDTSDLEYLKFKLEVVDAPEGSPYEIGRSFDVSIFTNMRRRIPVLWFLYAINENCVVGTLEDGRTGVIWPPACRPSSEASDKPKAKRKKK